MTYVLPSERVTLELDGPSVVVTSIISEAIHALGASRAAAWAKARGDAELNALSAMYDLFVAEAQPTWDIVDHRGPVPTTAGGMLRLPLTLGLSIYEGWLATIVPKASAIDKLIEPSELRDQLNAQLREKRKAA